MTIFEELANANICDMLHPDDLRKYCECIHRAGLYDPICTDEKALKNNAWQPR